MFEKSLVKDVLFIGNQARPKLFDLEIVCPQVLYEEVVEVEERLILLNQKVGLRRYVLQLNI